MAQFKDYKQFTPEARQAIEAATIFKTLEENKQKTADAEKQAKLDAERQAELKRQGDADRAARQKEKEAEARRLKQKERENIEVNIKQRFFTANPSASQSDFERVKESLLNEYFIERMQGQKTADQLIRSTTASM